MNITTQKPITLSENQTLPLSKKMIDILQAQLDRCTHLPCEGVIINFRDPAYGPETGGYHPVEIMISSSGMVLYVTDFSFVGSPPFSELAKDLDFDCIHEVFEQFGRAYPLRSGFQLFRTWQSNFCSYYSMGVFEVTSSLV